MPLLKAARGLLCIVVGAALGAALGACSYLPDMSKKIDYKSANKLPPLEVPPDLTRPTTDDRYVVPDVGGRGTATYSEYSRDRTQAPAAGNAFVLPQSPDARLERDGGQRWLVVKGAPDQVWPVVKGFWQEIGFIVNLEVPEAGIMETDWAENRARVDSGGIRNILGKLLDTVYSSAERDKFRTRLERGTQPGTTEVYISHRGMQEVFVDTARKEETMWQPRPPDLNLEIEMLGRLMTRFGVEQQRVKAQLAAPRGGPVPQRASLDRGAGTLALDEQFDRAWRRVGLALDRVGFTVEDRDRSKGLYFVRYIDPKIDSASSDAKKGMLARMFSWGGDSSKSKTDQYRIEVKEAGQGCEVKVYNKEGAQENSDTAGRILTLLHDQLK